MTAHLLPGLHAAPNAHPMFVHFPIALWLTALLLWLLAVALKRDELFSAGRWLLYLGAAGAVASVASGLVATARMGHEAPGHDLVHRHRDLMITTATLGLVVAAAAFVTRERASAGVRAGLLAGLLVTNALMLVGTDRGALLVFGYGIGTAGLTPPEGHHEHAGPDHEEGRAHPGAGPSEASQPGPEPAAHQHETAGHVHGHGAAGHVHEHGASGSVAGEHPHEHSPDHQEADKGHIHAP